MQVVGVGVCRNVEHCHGGKRCGAAQCLAGAGNHTLALEFGEHRLERAAHVAADAEHFRQVPLALDVRLLRQRFKQLFAGRQGVGARMQSPLRTGGVLAFGFCDFCHQALLVVEFARRRNRQVPDRNMFGRNGVPARLCCRNTDDMGLVPPECKVRQRLRGRTVEPPCDHAGPVPATAPSERPRLWPTPARRWRRQSPCGTWAAAPAVTLPAG